MNVPRCLRTHQVNAHPLVESVLLEHPLTDIWECSHCAPAKMCGEERTANRKFLDLAFDGYWEDFQPNL